MYSPVTKGRAETAIVCCLVSVALLSALASAQQFAPATAANAKQFVGIWKANFHGNSFFTVTLAIIANSATKTRKDLVIVETACRGNSLPSVATGFQAR